MQAAPQTTSAGPASARKTREAGERRRGRPRDATIDGRILEAARTLAGDCGMREVPIGAIAEMAGVGKPTVYLRHANRPAVMVAAIEDLKLPARRLAPAKGLGPALISAVEDDRQYLLGPPQARFLRAALDEAGFDEAVAAALDASVLAPRRRRVTTVLERGGVASPAAQTAATLLQAPLLAAMALRLVPAQMPPPGALIEIVLAGLHRHTP